MDVHKHILRDKISTGGLKVTPQRVAILETLVQMKNHPTADNIYSKLQKQQPNISLGTVYKTLETLATHGIINKVNTDTGLLRYDAITENHHHLICIDKQDISDYFDQDLDRLLTEYFTHHPIPGFTIKHLKLHIIGSFTRNHKH
ncbi:MAG: transcriptional repressor [Bacteroidia bacterium]|nr:transcriptional repressor [Bacteroidales bacterium]MDD3011953.1 transcriptional repressor [Bacteroidales bacterium]NCD00430.1 transcriptional repressor [Bacteroidia bacterium]HPE87196.1 transcriptional repressor [Bacteroidales bacterium]